MMDLVFDYSFSGIYSIFCAPLTFSFAAMTIMMMIMDDPFLLLLLLLHYYIVCLNRAGRG